MVCKLICLNDAVMHVVVGEGAAKVEAAALACMADLKEQYYAWNKGSFRSEAEYKSICYWHLHDAPITIL